MLSKRLSFAYVFVLSSLCLSLSLSLRQYQGVLFDLIRRVSSDLLTKMQCVDYYSTDIETRRFYRLDTSVIKLFMNVSHFCVDYLVSVP